MKKYISPSYEINELEIKDVIAASAAFSENTDEQNGKIDYVVKPESIFGF